MDAVSFRKYGREMVDYIANYLENIGERPVNHQVQPGYLQHMLPSEAPEVGEEFDSVMKDIERCIMPGITHWQSPQFHAYYPAGNAYPAILGDMLTGAIGCVGFSWATSPACTELEMLTTDWLGKMLDLPAEFLHSGPGEGGGVIQVAASEAIFLCLLAARARMVTKLKQKYPHMEEATIMSKLVAYCSDQANSSVPRAGLLGALNVVQLPADDNFSLRSETLRDAILRDRADGKIPFFVCATLGTTGSCSFDDLEGIGPICEENDVWLHVDAAYAGNAFVCPEFRHYMAGIEYAHTFCTNPHKWMLVPFDMSVLWVRDRALLVDEFRVDPIYLKHKHEEKVPDYRHWQIPLSRRFRALKLWFTLRSYGVHGIQKYIRNHCEMAHVFEDLLLQDERFEIIAEVTMGLVCFRLMGDNELTKELHDAIVADKRLYMIPSTNSKLYYLRFAICAEHITSEDIRSSFDVIKACADHVIHTDVETKTDTLKLSDEYIGTDIFPTTMNRTVTSMVEANILLNEERNM